MDGPKQPTAAPTPSRYLGWRHGPYISLAEASEQIIREDTEAGRLRWVFEFLRGADLTEPGAHHLLIAEEPATTGDERFDAILAASAAHVAYRHKAPTPPWCMAPGRFLITPWWIPKTRQGRKWALSRTPAAFAVRGVFIERRDLTNV